MRYFFFFLIKENFLKNNTFIIIYYYHLRFLFLKMLFINNFITKCNFGILMDLKNNKILFFLEYLLTYKKNCVKNVKNKNKKIFSN